MNAIDQLIAYALRQELIDPADVIWARNRLLRCMGRSGYEGGGDVSGELPPLWEILRALTEEAVERGLCGTDIVSRDLFDTALMGELTPRPGPVRRRFARLYEESPKAATDWFYALSGDVNYIRRDRIAKDRRWRTETAFGTLDISINLSKPEKDPNAAAAARRLAPVGYPRCPLCAENEGYAGRGDHPARQNHRVIPLTVAGERWYFQYSPYVYFNEHCILLSAEHRPMEITEQTFRRLLHFVEQFPHYFMGSNADLPIVGGSIQTHDHFQGGRYTFPMDQAAEERSFLVPGHPQVSAAILRWPLSVLRLRAADPEALTALAGHILNRWRAYSDPAAGILSSSNGEPHNTLTPIARRRGADYELDLALRNNRTTAEHPLGLFHPHAELHHIKRETIGLIEVMGLAVLPPRLEPELQAVERALLTGADLRSDPLTFPHAPWAEGLRRRYAFTGENVGGILQREVGLAFAQCLCHAGVFKASPEGREAFGRFVESL